MVEGFVKVVLCVARRHCATIKLAGLGYKDIRRFAPVGTGAAASNFEK